MDLDQLTRAQAQATQTETPIYTGKVSRIAGSDVFVVVPSVSPEHEYGPAHLGSSVTLAQGDSVLVLFDTGEEVWVLRDDQALTARVTALESSTASLDTRADALEANATDLDTRVTALEANPDLGWRTGDIKTIALAAAPSGWLLCDGSGVTSTHSALRAALIAAGSPYGTDGSSNPKLPDLRGRTPLGAGAGTGLTNRALGATGGKETVKLTAAESGLPAHNHPWNDPGFGIGVNNESNPGGATGHYVRSASGNAIGTNTAQDAANAHENMPPFVALNYIIKT